MVPAQPDSPMHSNSQANARAGKLEVMARRKRDGEWDQLGSHSVFFENSSSRFETVLGALNDLVNFDCAAPEDAHSEIQLRVELCLTRDCARIQSARRSLPAYTLKASPRAKPHKSSPKRAAVDTANELGADTPTTPDRPAISAFCTISKLVLPLTTSSAPVAGNWPSSKSRPMALSTALCRPMSSRTTPRPALGRATPAACKPPVRSKLGCRFASSDDSPAMNERPKGVDAGAGCRRSSKSSIIWRPHTPQAELVRVPRRVASIESTVPGAGKTSMVLCAPALPRRAQC